MRKFKSEAIITFDPVQQVEFNRQTSEAINVLMSKYNARNRLKTLIFMGAFVFLGTRIYSACKAIKDYSVEGKDFGITRTGNVFNVTFTNDNTPTDSIIVFRKEKQSDINDESQSSDEVQDEHDK